MQSKRRRRTRGLAAGKEEKQSVEAMEEDACHFGNQLHPSYASLLPLFIVLSLSLSLSLCLSLSLSLSVFLSRSCSYRARAPSRARKN